MTENVAAVNLTRQRKSSQLTRFGEDTRKGEKSSFESDRKICFQEGRSYPHSKDCSAKGKKSNKFKRKGNFERSKIGSPGSKKPSNQVTTSPSFLGSNSDDSLDVFASTTLFEDNEGSNTNAIIPNKQILDTWYTIYRL